MVGIFAIHTGGRGLIPG